MAACGPDCIYDVGLSSYLTEKEKRKKKKKPTRDLSSLLVEQACW